MYRIGLIPNVIPIAFILQNSRFRKFPGNLKMVSLVIWILQVYTHLHTFSYNVHARGIKPRQNWIPRLLMSSLHTLQLGQNLKKSSFGNQSTLPFSGEILLLSVMPLLDLGGKLMQKLGFANKANTCKHYSQLVTKPLIWPYFRVIIKGIDTQYTSFSAI